MLNMNFMVTGPDEYVTVEEKMEFAKFAKEMLKLGAML